LDDAARRLSERARGDRHAAPPPYRDEDRAARLARGREPAPRVHSRVGVRRRQDHRVHRPARPRDPVARGSRARRPEGAPPPRHLAALLPARARAGARHRAAPDRADGARAGGEHRGGRDSERAAAGGPDPMIPEHVMHELRYIEVYTGKKIRNQRVGAYQSPMRGPGFDFDEHQPYRPGDDVRRIDWNVTARLDAPYVRHTHAERELNVMIAMDVSRSMDIGTSK